MKRTKLNKEEIEALKKQQATLRKIDNKEKVFFNIALYVNKWGLVKSRKVYGKSPTSGNKIVVGHTYHLTDKGRRILNANLWEFKTTEKSQ